MRLTYRPMPVLILGCFQCIFGYSLLLTNIIAFKVAPTLSVTDTTLAFWLGVFCMITGSAGVISGRPPGPHPQDRRYVIIATVILSALSIFFTLSAVAVSSAFEADSAHGTPNERRNCHTVEDDSSVMICASQDQRSSNRAILTANLVFEILLTLLAIGQVLFASGNMCNLPPKRPFVTHIPNGHLTEGILK